MNQYHYQGHVTNFTGLAGERRNPYRYIQKDGQWVAEVGFGENERHFIVEIRDLATVLNLSASKINETLITLSDGSQQPIFELRDAIVPTWVYDNGGVACHRWPGTGEKISLGSKLLGLKPGFRTRIPGTDPLDYRRQNLKSPGDSVEKEWPLAVNSAAIARFGDPRQATIIQTFPGADEPVVNPYSLVELNGERFYRMKALNGEILYFDEQDLARVLRIDGEETPITTWYKNKKGKREKEGYMVCRTTSRSPRGAGHVKMHHLIMGETWTNAPPGMTVDHINWNKWDNRRVNLRLANQTTQLKNRAPLEFSSSAPRRQRL